MFSVAWFTRSFTRNNFLIFLACGYLWVALLDLMHALVFKGMNVFVEGSGNLSVQFWLCARYLEAILLLYAPFAATKKQNDYFLLIFFGAISVCFAVLIFTGHFPAGFIDGQGITEFKLYSEYIIVFILLAAIFSMHNIHNDIPKRDKYFIYAAIVLTICAELAFTFYIEVHDISNLVGHVFKFLSFWLLFHAIVISNLTTPFISLQKSKDDFRRLFENSEVSIWNEDFSDVIYSLAKIREEGVTDLAQYFRENEKAVWDMAAKVEVLNVNEATLNLFGAKSIGEFRARISETFAEDAIEVFQKGLHAIWKKKKVFRSEANYRTLDGELINCIISFQIPENEDDFNSIPVTIVDITHRKQNEDRIWHQANFDDLTGLANRNLFSTRLSEALKIRDKNGTSVTLLCIDLDGFKHVNDTLGHLIGDNLLEEAAQRLINLIKESGTVARLGGDEFAILLPDISDTFEIETYSNNVLKSLACPYHLQGRDCFVSASIGITVAPNDGNDFVTLMRKADSALYRAKAKGRNNYEFFSPEIDAEVMQRKELEEALHHALKNDEFLLNYQPIVNAETGNVECIEALIRWNRPGKGPVPPFSFIPLAEEIGLIVPIGEWVLRESCKTAANWARTRMTAPGISVNLSSRQFQSQDIAELVRQVLCETNLPAEKLTLEITESLLLEDNHTTLEQLHAIRELGVKLSIDDFGTGYSSLSYLKKLPVTTIKIDRSFVTHLPADSEDATLVKAILSMAESLGLDVVAEGVETEIQSEFLKSLNCQYLQGYLFSRPLSDSDLMEYLVSIYNE